MPRIRKKTSKRTNLHQRARIKHKAAETRKKRNKDAKKNTQWKTKNPKDPGIPSNFPYKDQILAEIAEQRRQAADDKEKRKEERKAAKAKALEESTGNDSAIGNGVKKTATSKVVDTDIEVNDDEVPTLLNPDYPNLQAVLAKSDVVIHILDVRDPLSFRSSHLEELVRARPDQKLMLVLNKIDTCPREAVVAWATHLRSQHPTFIFRAASSFLPGDIQPQNKTKEKEKPRTDDALGTSAVLGCLSEWAQNKASEGPLLVAVTGTTNAGKSTFINSLLRKAACPIYKLSSTSPHPSTTIIPQQVTLDHSGRVIHFIDSPGLSWHSLLPADTDGDDNAEAIRVQDILLRSRGRIDKLKDPTPAVNHIVSRATKQDLMLLYNLPAFEEANPVAFLSGVARSHSLIKKGGDPDLNGAARIVLRDWNTGNFPRYTMPPPINSAAPVTNETLIRLYAEDEPVLPKLESRQAMRKGKGIVKFTSGVVNTGQIVLDAAWTGTEQADSSGDEDDLRQIPDVDMAYGDEDNDDVSEGEGIEDRDDDDDEDEDGDEQDTDSDDEKGSEVNEALHQVPMGKRKRRADKSSVPPPRPAKKVSFGSQQRPRQAAPAALKSALKNKRTSLPGSKKTGTTATTKKGPKVHTGVHQAKDGEQAYDFTKFF